MDKQTYEQSEIERLLALVSRLMDERNRLKVENKQLRQERDELIDWQTLPFSYAAVVAVGD